MITYLWFGVTDDDLMNSFKEIKRRIRSPKEIDSNKISKRIDKLEYDVTKRIVIIYERFKDKVSNELIREISKYDLSYEEKFYAGLYIIHKISKKFHILGDIVVVLEGIINEKEWKKYSDMFT